MSVFDIDCNDYKRYPIVGRLLSLDVCPMDVKLLSALDADA